MLTKLSVYVQELPQRRIALVPQNQKEGSGSDESPLIISVKESTSEVMDLIYTREPEFDNVGWTQLQPAYGYVGNVALGVKEGFIMVVLEYEAITYLPYPEFTETDKKGNNVYRITQVGFISLFHNNYDSDPDINPDYVPPGHSWHSAEYYDNPEDLEDPNYPYYNSDDSEEYVGLNSSISRKNTFTSLKGGRPTADVTKRPTTKLDSQTEESEVVTYPYENFKKLFSSQYFYFSHTIDLTRNFQASMIPPANSPHLPHLSQHYPCDPDFLWNHSLLTCQLQYLEQVVTKDQNRGRGLLRTGLVTPIIQGYIEPLRCKELRAAAIISRVCWRRAGTRFHSRGLDDEGYTANLVETELLLSNHHYHFGFVTIRGSVPAFWTQEGNQLLGHRIQLTRGSDATQPASDRHFEWLQCRYGDIHIINLLGVKEGSAEAILSDRFEKLVHQSPESIPVSLTNFDFHVQCKKNQYEPAHRLIRQLSPRLESGGYFLWDIQSDQPVHRQTNIFRVNCLDCLDRTNVIQGLLLGHTLEKVQDQLGIRSAVASPYDLPDPDNPTFKAQLAMVVSNNGDTISKIYAGTGALQSGVAAGGKASFMNRIQDASKSVSRLYLHHFHDKAKQEAIDHLVGRSLTMPRLVLAGYAPPLPTARPRHSRGASLLNSDETGSTSTDSLVVHCGTYNVNGRIPSGKSLIPWLQPLQGSKMADIYVLAFEEIVELTPQQILAADLDRALQWESLLLRDLKIMSEEFGDPTGYVLLTSEQLVGICMFVFVKRDLLPSINQVRRCIKKTGLRGIAGNKGATAIRFRLEDTTFCFIACHFASGQTKFEERNRDFYTIHSGVRFSTFNGPDQHDVVIYMGDFNYRINLSNEEVRHYAHQGQLNLLIEKDQLLEARQRGLVFSGFDEGAITFPPTYKYDVGTEDYDTSEKQRIPAWTDRVLYKGSKASLLYYSLAPLYESDHRPVVAGFKVTLHGTAPPTTSSMSSSSTPLPKKLPPPFPPRPGTQDTPSSSTSQDQPNLLSGPTVSEPSSTTTPDGWRTFLTTESSGNSITSAPSPQKLPPPCPPRPGTQITPSSSTSQDQFDLLSGPTVSEPSSTTTPDGWRTFLTTESSGNSLTSASPLKKFPPPCPPRPGSRIIHSSSTSQDQFDLLSGPIVNPFDESPLLVDLDPTWSPTSKPNSSPPSRSATTPTQATPKPPHLPPSVPPKPSKLVVTPKPPHLPPSVPPKPSKLVVTPNPSHPNRPSVPPKPSKLVVTPNPSHPHRPSIPPKPNKPDVVTPTDLMD